MFTNGSRMAVALIQKIGYNKNNTVKESVPFMYNDYGPFPPNGGYYPPNSPYPPYNPYLQTQAMKQQEKKEIKVFSRVAGCCVIGYVLMQELLSTALYIIPSLRDAYVGSAGFRSAFGMIYSVLGVLLPFLVGAAFLKHRTGTSAMNFDKPNSISTMVLLIPVGFLICLAANYVTNIFIAQMEDAGFELAGGEFDAPKDWFGRIFYFLEVAVVPPLCEELAARGVVMMPLRKYGDRFAVFASAFVFAIMHGNLVQAPFAFLVGLAIGYAVCLTNSIWTGVLIHFANNLFSVGIEILLNDVTDEKTQNVIYYSFLGIAVAAGLVCAVLLVAKEKGKLILSRRVGTLTSGEKGGAYVLTVPMLIAIGSLLVITSQYVSYKGQY